MRPRRSAALLLLIGSAGCAGLIGLGDYAIDDRLAGDAAASDGSPEGSSACVATLRGTIRDPRGANPVPNAIVYVPSSTPAPMPSTIACDTCASLMTGGPIASVATKMRKGHRFDRPHHRLDDRRWRRDRVRRSPDHERRTRRRSAPLLRRRVPRSAALVRGAQLPN